MTTDHRLWTRRVPTPDDWHPTAPDGCVEARASLHVQTTGRVVVVQAVFGDDDTGYSRDASYPADRVEAAHAHHERACAEIAAWALVTRVQLERAGWSRW